MNNEHPGGGECRSPLPSLRKSMARRRRACARAAPLRPRLRRLASPWPSSLARLPRARPRCGASAGASAVGRVGGPLRGFAIARPRPAPPVGSGLGLALAWCWCAPRPALLPRGGSCAWRVPPRRPSALLVGAWLSAALRRLGLRFACRRGVPPLRRRLARLSPRRHTKRVALPLPWLRQGGIHATRAAGPLASPHSPHSLSASAYSIVTSGLSCCNAFCTFARS